jgi:hypothetical protein
VTGARVGYTAAFSLCIEEGPVSEKDPIRIFVTHLFKKDIDYLRVFEYLESRDNFFYLNSSNPDHMPAAGGLEAAQEEIRKQIEPAEAIVMPVAHFEENPELIGFQMDVAQAAGKPIIAIQSFGGTVAIQKEVIDRAADIVEWNDRSITDAIRRIARNENTTMWEVVDFDMD